MITSLNIRNFKSVRELNLSCRRINLFVGEPNTGKSNILEALGLWTMIATPGTSPKSFIRFHLMQNLFYDNLTDDPVVIECQGSPAGVLSIKFERDRFHLWLGQNHIGDLGYDGAGSIHWRTAETCKIRFYRYRAMQKYESADPGGLIPPDGPNLFSVVYGSRAMRQWVSDLFRPYGLAVVFKPHERSIELQKQQDGVITAYPYAISSDTLLRIVFYHAAMASNQDSVLVFEEPEAHAFPYYTKFLGERIAVDSSNQYFIATHNPYLLTAILEKARKEDVAVFAVQYRDYQTAATALSEDQIGRLLEADPFLGLSDVLRGE